MTHPSLLCAMRKHGFHVLLPTLLLMGLVACQREGVPAPAPATSAASQTPSSGDASKNVGSPSTTLLTVEPSRMDACDPAAEANVRWDATAASTVTTVEIWVSDGGEFKLFVAGGALGEAKTGPWTRPGARFQARDPGSKQILAELQIAGPQCQ